MELSKGLVAVLSKIDYDPASNVIIDGRPFGTIKPITANDLEAIVDSINQIGSLMLNRTRRATITELVHEFATPDEAYKFMFACTLLKNKFNTPIFSIQPFGNFISLHYQGDLKNVAFPDKKKEAPDKVIAPKVEKPAKAAAPKEEKKTPPKKRAKKAETKTPAKSTRKKRS